MKKTVEKQTRREYVHTSSPKKNILIISGIVCCTVLIAAAMIIFLLPKGAPESVVSLPPDSSAPEKQPRQFIVQDFFKDYLQQNGDTVGYIKIADTKIDYPVVKSYDEEDVHFYLDKDFNKNKSVGGALFLDYYNDIKNIEDYGNYVIYGHNMKNGSMFGQLMRYKNKNYLKDHNMIEFNTLYGNYKWEIFSVYVTDVSFYYIETQFDSKDEFGTLLNEMIGRSMYDTGVVPTKDDTILTLSTCTYEYNDARFVVHARLIR